MNFNYSYKAFLFSLLLVGGLVLFMYLIKLPKKDISIENMFDLEYAIDELTLKGKVASTDTKTKKNETHRAFNETEKFISELEKESTEQSKTTAEKLSEMDEAIEKSFNNITVVTNKIVEIPEANNKINKDSSTKFNTRNILK